MTIGQWSVKFDGSGWMVGISKTLKKRSGEEYERVMDPKYYPTLRQAISSLPEREAQQTWNSCDNFLEFQEKMGSAMDVILRDIKMADATESME